MISDQDVQYLAEYIDHWHNHWRMETFTKIDDIRSEAYCAVAANDILEAALMEKSRLPISAVDERLIHECTITDVFESYLATISAYLRECRCEQVKNMLNIQYWEGLCMWLDYALRKETNER